MNPIVQTSDFVLVHRNSSMTFPMLWMQEWFFTFEFPSFPPSTWLGIYSLITTNGLYRLHLTLSTLPDKCVMKSTFIGWFRHWINVLVHSLLIFNSLRASPELCLSFQSFIIPLCNRLRSDSSYCSTVVVEVWAREQDKWSFSNINCYVNIFIHTLHSPSLFSYFKPDHSCIVKYI